MRSCNLEGNLDKAGLTPAERASNGLRRADYKDAARSTTRMSRNCAMPDGRRSNRRSRVHHRASSLFQSSGRCLRRTLAGLFNQRKNDSVNPAGRKLQARLTKPAAAQQFLPECETAPLPAPPALSVESERSARRHIARSAPRAPRCR